VTTNYDAWLDEIIEPPPLALTDATGTSPSSAPAKRNVIHQIDDFSYDHLLTDNTVIHLHGSLSDPASMVVTTGDYLERYRNDGGAEVGQENKATSFLRSLFKSKTVLFIGYGLDELEILEYIILKSRNEAGTGEPGYDFEGRLLKAAEKIADAGYKAEAIQVAEMLNGMAEFRELYARIR
jgi:hypothetical protein